MTSSYLQRSGRQFFALTIICSLIAAVLVEPAWLQLWAQYRALKEPPAPTADAPAVRTSQPVA